MFFKLNRALRIYVRFYRSKYNISFWIFQEDIKKGPTWRAIKLNQEDFPNFWIILQHNISLTINLLEGSKGFDVYEQKGLSTQLLKKSEVAGTNEKRIKRMKKVRYCPHCGKAINTDMNICKYCCNPID